MPLVQVVLTSDRFGRRVDPELRYFGTFEILPFILLGPRRQHPASVRYAPSRGTDDPRGSRPRTGEVGTPFRIIVVACADKRLRRIEHAHSPSSRMLGGRSKSAHDALGKGVGNGPTDALSRLSRTIYHL